MLNKTQLHKSVIILVFVVFSFGCSDKKESKDDIYYIIKHPENKITVKDINIDTNTNTIELIEPPPSLEPPSPPTMFYGDHNFILLDSSRIFYHNKSVYFRCGTGIDFSKPPMLELYPDSIREIKINELPNFLKTHISDSTYSRKFFYASISSPTDTVRNKGFKILADYFKEKDILRYTIRNWTEEEQYVVTAKINNKHYDPRSVKWKVGFGNNFFLHR